LYLNEIKSKNILILGDGLILLIVTLIGFATHGESGVSFLPRMSAAFIPLLIGWFLLAPWFGLFNIEIISTPTQPPPFSKGKWGRLGGGCDALCRAASSCLARTDSQRADHSNLRRCAKRDIGIGNDDLARAISSFEALNNHPCFDILFNIHSP
jgi:hypothetical protein